MHRIDRDISPKNKKNHMYKKPSMWQATLAEEMKFSYIP